MKTGRFPYLRLALPLLALGLTPAWTADELAEIDRPASNLEQILAHPAEIGDQMRETRVVVATLDPMTTAAWHTHPSPVYVYVDEGTLTMEIEGQEPYDIQAGEAVAEPLNSPMRIHNRGDEQVRLIVFQISPPTEAFLEEGTAAAD